MDRRTFLSTLAGAGAAVAAPQSQTQRPNIVILFADDLGYSDIGCFGGEIRTPNIDSLARNGVRFTQFYNTARCCPSRATLLTGLYAHQAGIGHMVNPRPLPAYAGSLKKNTKTFAEVVKPAGYQTFMSGKWHVTPYNAAKKENWPVQRGFDKYYGIIHGATNYFDPHTLVRDNEPIHRDRADYYLTDAIGANAVQYIEQATGPFLLYTAFTSPHWPLHALEPDIARYKGRYKEGWDALRHERRQRMVRMGILDKKWRLTPRDAQVPAWKDAPDKVWQQRRMEVYAAQVDRMDQNIGRIIDALRRKGQLENTLVMFFADNGGCAEELAVNGAGTAAYIESAKKRGVNVTSGNRPDLMPGGENTFASYGLPWANASNTPFRLYKHWVHEGGISSPFVAHWPNRIHAKGKMSNQPAHLIDILPTCADLAGATAPAVEGRSLVPGLEGGTIQRTDAIYWEHEGNRAVREGNWKLVSKHPNQWELFDIRADRTEMNDLASREPQTVARLTGMYDKWAARVGAEDWKKIQQIKTQ